MESFILYSHSYMQDWPAEQGSIDLCATSEYPNKKDVLKNIVHAMGCAPGSQDEVETYEKLDREINYEILYDLSDPGIKRTVTEKADEPFTYGYYEEGYDGLALRYVPEGYTTQKEYRLKATYYIRMSSENEELLCTVANAILHPSSTFYLGVGCQGYHLAVKDEAEPFAHFLKKVEEGYY